MSWNSAAAHRALDYIRKHPDEWDQANWRCSSGMCFAGVICALGGGKWVNPQPTNKMSDCLLWANQADEDAGLRLSSRYDVDGRVVSAGDRAARLLGIFGETGLNIDLFASEHTIEDLEELIEIMDARQEAMA